MALASLLPRSMEGQMIAVLALTLLALFAALTALEIREHESAIETAESDRTLDRLSGLYPALQRIPGEEIGEVVKLVSSCHFGYTVTPTPYPFEGSDIQVDRLRAGLARSLDVSNAMLRAGYARLTREQFSYHKCAPSEIDLPVAGIVVSLQLPSGQWLNAEIHPHEWHFRELLGWMLRVSAIFVFVGIISILFMRRLSRPLNNLTSAARHFGEGLTVSKLQENGPDDVRRAIASFNTMQLQVADTIERRTNTLAAISHDVRTPLTALRVKAELIDDAQIREDLIRSIERMEGLTASALEFLKGQSRSEPMRLVDLSTLLESECSEFEELGHAAIFTGVHGIQYTCRPDALARAVRNLIDNAIKYGGGAEVALRPGDDFVEISVADLGPGIPAEQRAAVLEPFQRLSAARENHRGGFGLGLAIVKAIAEGHDGKLILAANQPRGLVAILRLPQPNPG